MRRTSAAAVVGLALTVSMIGGLAQATAGPEVFGPPTGTIIRADGSSTATVGGDFVDVAADYANVWGLRRDGAVLQSTYGSTPTVLVPPGDVTAISAVDISAAALHRDGTVTTWADGRPAPNDLGSDNVAISSGPFYVMSLKSNGTVQATGTAFTGQNQIPPGLKNVVAISAGGFRGVSGTHCAFGSALKSDGSVVAWGSVPKNVGCYDRFLDPGKPPADLPGLMSIAAGSRYLAGITATGRVLAWNNGQYLSGLSPQVSDHVVALGGGRALKSDGSVVPMWSPECDADYACSPDAPPFTGVDPVKIVGDYALSVPRAVGNPVLQLRPDGNQAGRAEAFSFTAGQAGATDRLRIYLDTSSKAATVKLGIYGSLRNQPKSLLATGTISEPAAGRWNQATLSSSVNLTAGSTYWIAVLSPAKAGRVAFRDREHDGSSMSVTSQEGNLIDLPSTWRTGSTYQDSPISAYGVPLGAS